MAGNQEFFFRFLRACNNHALNTMLAQHLAACLSQSVMVGARPSMMSTPCHIYQQPLISCVSCSSQCLIGWMQAGEEERVDDLITRTARLKIVARFLGVLAFGPYWMPPEALQAYEYAPYLYPE
jgi:hypothetical protein